MVTFTNDTRTLSTLRQIADALDVSHDTVRSRWRTHESFPAPVEFYPDGRGRRWVLEEVVAWRRSKPELRGAINHRDRTASALKSWETRRSRSNA